MESTWIIKPFQNIENSTLLLIKKEKDLYFSTISLQDQFMICISQRPASFPMSQAFCGLTLKWSLLNWQFSIVRQYKTRKSTRNSWESISQDLPTQYKSFWKIRTKRINYRALIQENETKWYDKSFQQLIINHLTIIISHFPSIYNSTFYNN